MGAPIPTATSGGCTPRGSAEEEPPPYLGTNPGASQLHPEPCGRARRGGRQAPRSLAEAQPLSLLARGRLEAKEPVPASRDESAPRRGAEASSTRAGSVLTDGGAGGAG